MFINVRKMVALATLICYFGPTNAQTDWPAKPIKIMVPQVAGGYYDRVIRILAPQLSRQLKTPIIVENRDGANGAIGTGLVRNSAPDGYTLLVGSIGPFGIAPALDEKLSYDPVRDFAPVALLATNPTVLLVSTRSPYTTLRSFVEASRSSDQPLLYSSFGLGTSSHLSMERIRIETNARLSHVPYRGTGPATMAVVGGDVQALVSNVQDALPHIRGGKIRALAVAGKTRLNALPDTPTFSEAGYPNIDASNWLGILAPLNTPPAILDRLNSVINVALNDPEVRKQLSPSGEVIVLGGTRIAFQEHITKEIDRWKSVVKVSGIKKE